MLVMMSTPEDENGGTMSGTSKKDPYSMSQESSDEDESWQVWYYTFHLHPSPAQSSFK